MVSNEDVAPQKQFSSHDQRLPTYLLIIFNTTLILMQSNIEVSDTKMDLNIDRSLSLPMTKLNLLHV